MHDLSNVSYDEAVTKLASWYQQKQASIGEGVGRLGEWIGNNPGTAATLGGGALGGVIGGATEGPDGWRGRVRRSLTGAVAGAGIGGGGALAAKSLFGGHPAAAAMSAGPKFDVNGKPMQFDPKAIAADPNLSGELSSLNEPSANQTVLGGLRTGWRGAMTAAPITTAFGLPAVAAREIYHQGTKVSPGAGRSGPVADLYGSTRNWGSTKDTATSELKTEAMKGQPKEFIPPPPDSGSVRARAVNNMIDAAGSKKVNPIEANQHFDLLSKLKGWFKTPDSQRTVPGSKMRIPVGYTLGADADSGFVTNGGFKGIRDRRPDMKLKPAGSFRGRALAPLAITGLMDLARHGLIGASDDNEKKQKLLDLVRQHAKPVQG